MFFNPYTTADRFCLFSFAAAASKQVRLDKRSRYKCVLDLPLPHLIDARPWRCLDCGVTFSVVPADVRASFPQVLHHKIVKQKALWFSGRFLVHTAQKFAEMFNAAAVKRFMLDMYIANSFSLAYEEKRLALLACIPSLRALRGVLRKALASFLPNLVMEIQKSAHVYSGSAIKGDGNYKVPPRIRGQGCRSPNLCVYLNIHIYIYIHTCARAFRDTRAYLNQNKFLPYLYMLPMVFCEGSHPKTAVIYAWCGIDGCLLKPCKLLLVESWPYLKVDLEELADQLRLGTAFFFQTGSFFCLQQSVPIMCFCRRNLAIQK